MSIPHFKDSSPIFAYKIYTSVYSCNSLDEIFVESNPKYNQTYTSENMQIRYLIHLIFSKTPEPEKGIMQLIETNDLKNIELAYLLTYSNEES